jgi:nucleotide-binding universal stress UspA family protein
VHILIATAGVLPPGPVTELVRALLHDDGIVSVVSVIEVPHPFLDTIETEQWHPFGDGANQNLHEASQRYVEERGRRLTEPIVSALAAEDIPAQPLYVEGADVARALVETAVAHDVDLIVMGATRPLFDESAWSSVSSKVVQEANLPVLLVPRPRPPAEREGSHGVTVGRSSEP